RSRVRFHGAVSDERLRGFYAAADIFVAPSRFESFGLILVEGMMFSKPVVGCNAGGMVEVVEDGVSGLLAEPGDVASLDACLERLITDADLRARMGAAARVRYEQRFTAERMTSAYLQAMDAAARHDVSEAATPVASDGALVGKA
ncbi:MAG TPA: glycosyltransferase family 4 protein, partial [Ktedonobacterales bacterium]